MIKLNIDEIKKEIINVSDTTYLVHNYHPYAAKFIPQIPRYLIKKFTEPYDVVMDPFCGSGTAIVEALLLDRNGIGIEINPIGYLVSKVKTTPLKDYQILIVTQFIKELKDVMKSFLIKSESRTLLGYTSDNIPKENPLDLTSTLDLPNKFHWFKRDVLNAILHIKQKIDNIHDIDARDFLLVALSSIIIKVSNQESETRYAAINKKVDAKDVFVLFEHKVKDMIKRMKEFSSLVSGRVNAKIYKSDSRFIYFIPENSVDFVITSPPYPNTYDYYLYHKLRMIILGFDYRDAQEKEIGSRHKHSSQKEDIHNYLESMQKCFYNFSKILKPEHYFAIVIGDSVIRGIRYDGFEIIKNIADITGFKVEDHISYELDVISRLFNKSFRAAGKKEHIIVLKNTKEAR